MSIPGFTAEIALYASPRSYVATDAYGAAGSEVLPQYCGPCLNGRRQCSGYTWVCYEDIYSNPLCGFGGSTCPIVCQEAGFRTWSTPCDVPIGITTFY